MLLRVNRSGSIRIGWAARERKRLREYDLPSSGEIASRREYAPIRCYSDSLEVTVVRHHDVRVSHLHSVERRRLHSELERMIPCAHHGARGAIAENFPSVRELNGARQNFGGGCRATVHQNV